MRSDRHRSTTLEALSPLLAFQGAQFFSLQFGAAAAELRAAPALDVPTFAIIDGCSRDKDFAETAAFMATLDLVISVDTSVAHLAGAMGLPLWLLLPHLADWRWLERREDSPWYPTARLFRQPAAGDWTAVAERVREQLEAFCAAPETQNQQDSQNARKSAKNVS
jgi:ADP-heptose:LPS heptosyltransferase